jgi:NADPH-dependent ferric siderophore reductase
MVAGDSRDLPAIRHILERLPNDSYGQVFIEIVAEVQVVQMDAPAGVSVTWLHRRSFGRSIPNHTFGSARGETIERAVLAWTTEWLEPGCQCEHGPFYVWIGCALSPTVDRLHSVLHTMLGAGEQSAHHHHG